MISLSFRQFLLEVEQDDDPPDMYQAASDELNTGGEVGVQVFDWVPFEDGVFRFGQTFQTIKKEDEDEDVVWVKPLTGKEHGDEDGSVPSTFKLNVMKCARQDPNTGKMVQIQCPALPDTKEFPIPKKQWRKMVNKPFQNAGAAAGVAAPGELPGM